MGSPRRTEVVVWDWNGTLLDDVEVALHAMNIMLAERGIPPIAGVDAYRSVFRFPITDFYASLGIHLEDDFVAASGRYMGLFNRAVVRADLFSGALGTLDAVRRRGVRQVLISATRESVLRHQLGPHAVHEYLDTMLGIEDGAHASKAHLVAEWLERAPFEPGQVLMVGDTNHDVEIAADLGLRFVQVAGGHQSPSAHAPHPVVDDLALVTRFL